MSRMVLLVNSIYVDFGKVKAIIPADADKVRRYIKRKGIDKNSEKFLDLSSEKEIKSMMIFDDGSVAVSSQLVNTLIKRYELNDIGGKE